MAKVWAGKESVWEVDEEGGAGWIVILKWWRIKSGSSWEVEGMLREDLAGM